jgi:hypothetical protein
MKIIIILLVFISVSGYSQGFFLQDDSPFGGRPCKNQIIVVDSLGKEIDSIQYSPYFTINNGIDSIKLEELYNIDLINKIGLDPFRDLGSILSGSTTKPINEENVDSIQYCISCYKKEVKIIDSIDVNRDGVKELILFREWSCSVRPPIFDQFCIGCEDYRSSRYEVWDVKSKKKIFEILNYAGSSITVSTNVGYSSHYKFDVDVDKKGCFYLSNPSGEDSKFEMGKYKYDYKTQKYEKVKP